VGGLVSGVVGGGCGLRGEDLGFFLVISSTLMGSRGLGEDSRF